MNQIEANRIVDQVRVDVVRGLYSEQEVAIIVAHLQQAQSVIDRQRVLTGGETNGDE
ncbi:MAG: hypothetical protein HWE20_14715 [Gammaproteobacteria bacterium]|nr:hypothetical protein [Gammaproteobacteria bacterium]